MAMTISVTVPEAKVEEVKFPCVTVSSLDRFLIWFSGEIGFWSDTKQRTIWTLKDAIRQRPRCQVFAPPGTEAKLVIESEDGTEFPRVAKDCSSGEYRYLLVDEKTTVKIVSRIPGDEGDINTIAVCGTKPLPPGTKTAITIRDGEISCEIEEPKDWLPVTIAGVRFRRDSEYLLEIENCDEGSSWSFDRDDVKQIHELTSRLLSEQP